MTDLKSLSGRFAERREHILPSYIATAMADRPRRRDAQCAMAYWRTEINSATNAVGLTFSRPGDPHEGRRPATEQAGIQPTQPAEARVARAGGEQDEWLLVPPGLS